jgi:hypothetical protein
VVLFDVLVFAILTVVATITWGEWREIRRRESLPYPARKRASITQAGGAAPTRQESLTLTEFVRVQPPPVRS